MLAVPYNHAKPANAQDCSNHMNERLENSNPADDYEDLRGVDLTDDRLGEKLKSFAQDLDGSETRMGYLIKTRKLSTQQLVAIKLCNRRAMEEGVTLFENSPVQEDPRAEAFILRQLQHPHVVRLVECFDFQDYFCEVFECLRGGDLFGVIQLRGSEVPLEQIRRLFCQLMQAVAYLHARCCVHLDVSPENCMLVDERAEQLVLIDFGVAKVLNPNQQFVERQAHQRPGKVNYMSPEVFYSTRYPRYNPYAADIYSSGITLLMMLLVGNPYDVEVRTARGEVVEHMQLHQLPAFSLLFQGRLKELLAIFGNECANPERVPDSAVALLNRMLGPEQYRPTAAQVLESEFCCANFSATRQICSL